MLLSSSESLYQQNHEDLPEADLEIETDSLLRSKRTTACVATRAKLCIDSDNLANSPFWTRVAPSADCERDT